MTRFFGGEFGDAVEATPLASLFLPPPLVRGRYRDWQGDLYDVMHVVKDVHEGRWMVLYRSLIDERQPMMVMNYAKFFGTVDTGAYRPVVRFSRVVEPQGAKEDRLSSIPPPLPAAATESATEPTTDGSASADGSDVGASVPRAEQSFPATGRGSSSVASVDDGNGATPGNGQPLPVGGQVRPYRRAPRAPTNPAAPAPSIALALPNTKA